MPARFAGSRVRTVPPLRSALAAGFLLLTTAGVARGEIAAEDPRLLRRMDEICRAQAMASDGLDEGTAALCRCAAPIFARHLTPEARTSFVEQNHAPDGPVYDDQQATFDEIVATCPQVKSD